MTDTLRTRIARVICDASWQHGRGLTIGQAEGVALDVLGAMREPTLEMEIAGTEAWLCEGAMEDRSRANWQSMIDEARTEDE